MTGIDSRVFSFSWARKASYRTAASRCRLAYLAVQRPRIIKWSGQRNHLLANFLRPATRRNRAEPSSEERSRNAFAVWTT